MNAGTVTLTVVCGPLAGREYVYEDGENCLIGRARDCDLRVPADSEHASVSRHHCMLEIDLPSVRLRDLGSRNGTYLNGESIGRRPYEEFLPETEVLQAPAHELRDADRISLGPTCIRVHIDLPRPDTIEDAMALTYIESPGNGLRPMAEEY